MGLGLGLGLGGRNGFRVDRGAVIKVIRDFIADPYIMHITYNSSKRRIDHFASV